MSANTQRSQITGIFPLNKRELGDFPQADQMNFIIKLQRIATNMLAISKLIVAGYAAPTTVTQRIENPNALQLAAMYYGDLRQWPVIVGASEMGLAVLDEERVLVRLPRRVK